MSTKMDRPETLRIHTECNLSGLDDEWDLDGIEVGDEIREAIAETRQDHDAESWIPGESLWVFHVHWNEKTDSVWVGAYGYRAGMVVS